MNFIEISKKNHAILELKEFWDGAFKANNTDTLRHYSMLDTMADVLKNFPAASVLTIGDNRGRDAAWAKKITNGYSIASDLNSSKLQKAVEVGYIDGAIDVDVESIQFDDNSFDFVICKEAFHHFPRPFLGFYEMLRVARLGVIVYEPVDCNSFEGMQVYPTAHWHDSYEAVGNYKYQISPREFLKVAWAVGSELVLMRGFNDPFENGMTIDEYNQKREYLDKLGHENKRQFNLMGICIMKKFHSLTLHERTRVFCRPPNPFEK